MMSDLAALATSDPDKFKTVAAEIAQKLKDAATSEGGTAGDILNKVAARFDSAAQSGNVSDLAPPAGGTGQGHGHHHGHRAHGAGGAGAAGGAAIPDGSQSVGQVIQGIISAAMNSATTSTAAG